MKMRPGHIDHIFAWHLKQGLDASGEKPIIVKVVPEGKKNERLS